MEFARTNETGAKFAGARAGEDDHKSRRYFRNNLKAAGFPMWQFMAAGYTKKELMDAGYSEDETQCASRGRQCLAAGCCTNGLGCYRKNATWAGCMLACEPGRAYPDGVSHSRDPWDCS